MKRDVPAPANESTELVTVKAYVDAHTASWVKASGARTGLGISGYLRMLIMRDLEKGHEERQTPTYPVGRSKWVKSYVDVDLWEQAGTRAELSGLSVSKYLLELILREQLDGHSQCASVGLSTTSQPGLEAA
jgi:hypothetical protein